MSSSSVFEVRPSRTVLVVLRFLAFARGGTLRALREVLFSSRALRQSADAAADFHRCIALTEVAASQAPRSWHARAHVGLGYALAMDGEFAGARVAWKRGLGLYPADAESAKRAQLAYAAAASAFVERVRDLEQTIDSNFACLLDE